MRTITLLTSVCLLSSFLFIGGVYKDHQYNDNTSIIIEQVPLEANNIRAWISNTGIIDQDRRTSNTPGFEWPKGSNKNAIFTTGLTLAGYINNQFRMSAACYKGEDVPGYCVNGNLQTNSGFKLYRVTRGDNQNNNPDWLNWGLMVPYGAPFKDANNNGTYEPAIDTPGVKNAAQTIFVCLTDADSTAHTIGEGFGGGTPVMGAEIHFTSWCYDNPGLEDMQFMKWVVINKNISAWDSTIISLVSDPDLGYSDDDYIGCDTTMNLGYCYNADNDDNGIYGVSPPAVGTMFLNCSGSNAVLSTFVYFTNTSTWGPPCEKDANGEPAGAYNYMKGIKKDGTPWVIPGTNPPRTTKFCYPGDPESGMGWTEGLPGHPSGSVLNCNGLLTGNTFFVNPAGDRRFVMNYKPVNQRINPGDSQVVIASQFIARGSSNLNSVTLLKLKADVIRTLCIGGFAIGINPISTQIPDQFNLYQNYPNPFNPVTKIKFDLPKSENVVIKIYDALGRETAVLVNEKLKAGIYSVDWNGMNNPSGVYFYKLTAGSFVEAKKMILIK